MVTGETARPGGFYWKPLRAGPMGQGTPPRRPIGKYYAVMITILDLTFGERALSDVG